jgi:hypothetical protein
MMQLTSRVMNMLLGFHEQHYRHADDSCFSLTPKSSRHCAVTLALWLLDSQQTHLSRMINCNRGEL